MVKMDWRQNHRCNGNKILTISLIKGWNAETVFIFINIIINSSVVFRQNIIYHLKQQRKLRSKAGNIFRNHQCQASFLEQIAPAFYMHRIQTGSFCDSTRICMGKELGHFLFLLLFSFTYTMPSARFGRKYFF